MMQQTEFDEICRNTERIVIGLKWTFAALFIVAVAFILPGCATTSAVQMCGMKMVGQNEQGITFVLMQCEAHE